MAIEKQFLALPRNPLVCFNKFLCYTSGRYIKERGGKSDIVPGRIDVIPEYVRFSFMLTFFVAKVRIDKVVVVGVENVVLAPHGLDGEKQ
jgi:hypothetical protein